MKEADNKLDKLFRSALEEYSSEPAPELINKLNKKMFFRDVLRFNFRNIFSNSLVRYSSLLVAFVAVVFTSLYLFNQTDSPKPLAQNNTSIPKTNDQKPEANTQPTISNNTLAENKTPISDNNELIAVTEDKKENRKEGSSENKSSLPNEKPLEKNVKGSSNNTDGNLIPANNIVYDKDTPLKRHEDNQTTNVPPFNTLNKTEQPKSGNILNSSENKTISKNILISNDFKDMKFSITMLPSRSAKLYFDQFGVNNKIDFRSSSASLDQAGKRSVRYLQSYIIEAYAGADYVNKIMTSSLKEHLDERKRTESPIVAYNFGMDFKYSIKNTFIQAGVNRSVLGENSVLTTVTNIPDSSGSHFNFEYKQIFIIDTTGWIIIWDSVHFDSIPILDTTTFTIKDSSWVSVYDTTRKEDKYKYNNRLTYYEIPVLVGFNFGNSPLRFNIATGVSFGFLTNSRGRLVKPFSDDALELNKANFPLNKIMYNYILRAGCFYRVNQRYGLFLRTSFKYNINSIFDKSYPVSQKYYTIGIQGGVFIHL